MKGIGPSLVTKLSKTPTCPLSFSVIVDESFSETPSCHGRPRPSGHGVRGNNLIFFAPRGESFWAGTSARISARTSAEYPAQKLYVGCFSVPALIFLSLLFWKKQGKPSKEARICSLWWTLKFPGKEGKNAPKSKGNSLQRKKQGNPKKQGKEDQGASTWGQKRYSQEFVFPSFGRSSGELFGVNSCEDP